MKKRRFLIITALFIVILGGFCVWFAINFMPCTERFNGVPLNEFDEATKVVVKSGTRTPFEITASSKVEYAKNFIVNRHDGWEEPCMIPVSPLLSIIFVNGEGEEIGLYGFWADTIVYISPEKQTIFPHLLLLRIDDEERLDLIKHLDIPEEYIDDSLRAKQINSQSQ